MEVKKAKKCSARRATILNSKPSAEAFVSFYRTLFSHHDRPSNESHQAVSASVKEYAESLRNRMLAFNLSKADVYDALYVLKPGKAAGANGISNEFLIYGTSEILVEALHILYDLMFMSGAVPTDLNTALLIPIPKSKDIAAPSDYRPISVSTPICTLLELLLRQRMPFLEQQHPNQFGYKKATSCKAAYYVVNESINYYRTGRSNCHVVSLDAAKAFDKLWRDGLFDKLKPVTDPCAWRLLHRYYEESCAVVGLEGFRSEKFKINEGVKQGGILSSLLFNFFMDGLLASLMELNVGALVGSVNTSALAYCDDILLISPVEAHMQKLLQCCEVYADRWKLSFNPSKSSCYSVMPVDYDFILYGNCIPKSKGFVYLGLPIGGIEFVEDFYLGKMRSCEKTLYSMKNIGCNPSRLHPVDIGFIYKQYCQSILKYGFEFIQLRKTFLDKLDLRQNTLLKNVLGVRHKARFKVVLNAIKVEQVSLAYAKHKVFGWKQCMRNSLTELMFSFLNKGEFTDLQPDKTIKFSSFSFSKQLREVIGSKEPRDMDVTRVLEQLAMDFTCNDTELRASVENVLERLYHESSFACMKELNDLLKVNF